MEVAITLERMVIVHTPSPGKGLLIEWRNLPLRDQGTPASQDPPGCTDEGLTSFLVPERGGAWTRTITVIPTEVTLSHFYCPIMSIAPPRFARSVGAPFSGGKNGRMCGTSCVIALIGAVTTAIKRSLRSLKTAYAVWKCAFLTAVAGTGRQSEKRIDGIGETRQKVGTPKRCRPACTDSPWWRPMASQPRFGSARVLTH